MLLLAFFADPRFRAREIVVGQFVGMAAIVGVSMAAASLALALSPRALALLGVAPVSMGMWQLWSVWRRPEPPPARRAAGRSTTLAVAVVTVANGGDNVALYAPLFAGRAPDQVAVICAVFAVLLALWCAAARLLTGHVALEAFLVRWGARLTPFILIGLGLMILVRGGSPITPPHAGG